jgi:hypothetical protein
MNAFEVQRSKVQRLVGSKNEELMNEDKLQEDQFWIFKNRAMVQDEQQKLKSNEILNP